MVPSFFSIGKLAVTLQSDPDLILMTARRLGISPVEVRNNIPVFAGEVVEQLRAALVESGFHGRIAGMNDLPGKPRA